jgi:hypothetical protein
MESDNCDKSKILDESSELPCLKYKMPGKPLGSPLRARIAA